MKKIFLINNIRRISKNLVTIIRGDIEMTWEAEFTSEKSSATSLSDESQSELQRNMEKYKNKYGKYPKMDKKMIYVRNK